MMVAESVWTELCSSVSSKSLLTWGSLAVQTLAYLLASLPSLVFPYFSSLDSYRIQQPVRKPSNLDYWTCAKLVAFSHFGLFYPLAFSLYFYLGLGGIPVSWETMPSWHTTLVKLVLALYVEDTWHYFAHRALHTKNLYARIHKLHHTFTAPFSLAAEYAHPIETAVLGMGFFIPVLLFCDHVVFFWAWLALRTAQACDSHSGYNMWNPLWLLPFYGGSLYHDFHHSNFTGNYSSSFTHWDKIFGTDRDFKRNQLEKKKNPVKPKVG